MAWWRGEVIDRACVQVYCPRRDGPPARGPAGPRRYLDIEWLLDQAQQHAERTAYLGEAFPCFWPNVGPETLAAYLGCTLHFDEATSWADPLPVPAGCDWPDLKFDPANSYYRFIRDVTRQAMERFAGQIIVGVTDIHNGADTLAAIRDPEQLCLDMIERPDRVREAMGFLQQFRKDRFDENVAWTKSQGGTTTWLAAFSTGAYACLQNDFIVLISPAMDKEFVLDELNASANGADHVAYHLDGPGEVAHLDLLLSLDNLQAIQWVPGAGHGPQTDWLDLLRRIRQAGKSLHLYCETPAEAVQLVEELGPRGVLVQTWTRTQDEAERLVRDIERASAGRK